YGQVTNYTLVQENGDLKSSASLTYTITRSNAGKAVTYKVILQLTTFHGAWGVGDLGNTLDPHAGGAPPLRRARPPARRQAPPLARNEGLFGPGLGRATAPPWLTVAGGCRRCA